MSDEEFADKIWGTPRTQEVEEIRKSLIGSARVVGDLSEPAEWDVDKDPVSPKSPREEKASMTDEELERARVDRLQDLVDETDYAIDAIRATSHHLQCMKIIRQPSDDDLARLCAGVNDLADLFCKAFEERDEGANTGAGTEARR